MRYHMQLKDVPFKKLHDALPFLKCGYTDQSTESAHYSDMEYSPQEQEQYGVIGIEVKLC